VVPRADAALCASAFARGTHVVSRTGGRDAATQHRGPAQLSHALA
jgi:hypothetical protein